MAPQLLPELRQHLAQYLDFETLKAFSLVCKAWYLDAHPILWKHFSCRVPWKFPTSSGYAVWLEAIRENARSFRHVHNIECNERAPEIGELLLDRCRNLITIDAAVVMMDVGNPCRYWEETLRPLVEQNRASLRRLKLLVADSPFMNSLQLQTLMPSLSHLQSLELNVQRMTLEDLLPVLDACPSSLERLHLSPNLQRRNFNLENSITHPSSLTMATSLRLKHLHIHGTCYDNTLEDVLSHLAVHSLEELQISVIYPLRVSPTLRDALWRLTHLHLDRIRPSPERVVPHILGVIQPHQLRHVYLGSVDTESIANLVGQQHESLVFLNVGILKLHTEVLADIMATCGKLKHLFFTVRPFVDIRTLIDPQRPWVCTELEDFGGFFGLSRCPRPRPPPSSDSSGVSDSERSRQVEDQFMQRLGQLTKLRSLVQQSHYMDLIMAAEIDMEIMSWSLNTGLAHLKGLTNLQTLKFVERDLPIGIGIPEMEFIKQHWHCLKELAYYEMDDSDLEEWLGSEWPELKVTLNCWK
ncbi:MAG: hypothetical protein J3Q66DRAFT_406789 [Benniella sp.]|nr:MAG: hypothetical protein J3Q66DRAFT_406789 [Benniella sp.]